MKKERALEIRSLLVVYCGLAILACAADKYSHQDFLWSWRSSNLTQISFVFLGLLYAFVYVAAASVSSRLFRWAEELERFFAQVLTPLSYFQIIILALLSGFLEEWFFRGILLNHFGLITSSIFFGLAHFLPDRNLWKWSGISLIGGVFLGLIYQASHSLWLVAIIHSTINALLFLRLNLLRSASPSLT